MHLRTTIEPGDQAVRCPRRVVAGFLAAVVVAAFIAVAPTPGAPRATAQAQLLRGVVVGGTTPLAGYTVTLFATGRDGAPPRALATTTSDGAGAFELDHLAPSDPGAVRYLRAVGDGAGALPDAVALVSVLGTGDPPDEVVVNERTTVAAAYALARFTDGVAIAGPSPGLENASAMAPNLADPRTGEVGEVLATSPNGAETSTLATFGSLANAVAACVATPGGCAALFAATTTPEGAVPLDTFAALVGVAHAPWHQVAELLAVAQLPPAPYAPARDLPPDAWTLALRFDGDGQTMSGPGNIAVDHEGTLWVLNNYVYDPDPTAPVCGSDLLLRFTPDGQYVPGSPYTGGGLSGAGYGIDIDPYGDVWVGNYGFAAQPPGCPEADQPTHNSVSRFTPDGAPVSPAAGYTQGGISWPQGTESDDQGDIWIANCGNDSVTVFPEGDPDRAVQHTDVGIGKPFDLAVGDGGRVFVTGVESSEVAVLGPDGAPLPGSPISGGLFDRPMGIEADSRGNLWVSNSGFIDLPCPDVQHPDSHGGSLALLHPDGTPWQADPFTGGGLTAPWGNAIDGDDNVWVANFAGKRVSQFCGVPATGCRPGTTTGDPISPDVTGYGFDGLTRSTGLAIDTAGNVWVTNNWKEVPVQTNPGGYQLVAFVGLAAPVQPPEPSPRPEPTPSTTVPPATVRPRFTG